MEKFRQKNRKREKKISCFKINKKSNISKKFQCTIKKDKCYKRIGKNSKKKGKYLSK